VIRVLVDALPEPGGELTPGADECHHLLRVRRIKVDDHVELLDGRGGRAAATVIGLTRRDVELRVDDNQSADRESALHLEIAVAIPSQLSSFDSLLPALVQLGVDQIYLVPTRYSGRIKKESYLSRLQNIALQSLKQNGRLQIPAIERAPNWQQLCETMQAGNQHNIILHPSATPHQDPTETQSLGLLIGPEGGFSEEEIELAVDHGMGVRALGPRILKLETAVVGACFWAQLAYGDLR